MMQPSIPADFTSGASARERIDALLDEALKETFPASDSSAIGSGVAVIKQEDRERKTIDEANEVNLINDRA